MFKKIVTTGVLCLVLSLVGCDQNSDDLQVNGKDALINETKARSSMKYQDYYIGGIDGDDKGYDEDRGDCSNPDGENCGSLDWTIDRDTKKPIEAFIREINTSSTVKVFTEHLTLVKEIFPAPVVEGALANYFEVKYDVNPKSLNYSFKIKRIHDGVAIGTLVLKTK